MLFKLYLTPCLLLIGAILALELLGSMIPNYLSPIVMFSGIATASYNIAPWIGSALFLAFVVSLSLNTYKLWQWDNCKGDSCQHCGGMTEFRTGRYGPYFHCLACSKNSAY
jgi:hypothetical protein